MIGGLISPMNDTSGVIPATCPGSGELTRRYTIGLRSSSHFQG